MSLNPTTVLRRIKRDLGALFYDLELTDGEIMQTVFDETLVTFSRYFPLHKTMTINTDEDKVPGRQNVYYIKTDQEIISVSKSLVDHYDFLPPRLDYHGNMISRQIEADMVSTFELKTTFEFHPPNMVELHPKLAYRDFIVQLKLVHPQHLQTISTGYREEFMKMAILDTRISLYPIRNRFRDMNTAFGSIELFMDKLDNAESEREELLDKWERNMLKNHKIRKVYIY